MGIQLTVLALSSQVVQILGLSRPSTCDDQNSLTAGQTSGARNCMRSYVPCELFLLFPVMRSVLGLTSAAPPPNVALLMA